ncbi:uncharacterized protein LOC130911992 isoform X2 [Corythoichthys intestinalis]|uniref:uncharacterized protein LOC130911992 isoform X2 n=1 Tax=Corythoichthys intestinalis TaxID=161448 RepID=UPI0025A51AE9|nr:uncharacterized protein LOC130911992 isoform X2 [Corythoichthys intestinalis]
MKVCVLSFLFPQSIVFCIFVSDLYLSTTHAIETCQTTWFDDSDASGEGDSELLIDLRKKHELSICSDPVDMEVQIVARNESQHAKNIFHTHSASEGLLCLNREQTDEVICEDYKVKFTCSGQFCSECQTDWFDMDDPEGNGDSELIRDLLRKYPGKICRQPIAIQVRTVSEDSDMAEKFLILDATKGFVCMNSEQTDQRCKDYEVRFTCPKEFCEVSRECHTRWLNSDNYTLDEGDVESLYGLMKTYPGQVCRNPIQIVARTAEPGSSPTLIEDVVLHNDVNFGFACFNKEQKNNKQCKDYEVMLICPSDFCHCCRTPWFNLDDPTSGDGDYETLVELRSLNPDAVCFQPVAVEAMTISGVPANETGDVFLTYDANKGFVCLNSQQPEKKCQDYKVRFTCPPDFCSV